METEGKESRPPVLLIDPARVHFMYIVFAIIHALYIKLGTLLVSYYSLYELLGTLLRCMGKFNYLLVHYWYVVLYYVLFIVHYWPVILIITVVAITHALYIYFCTLLICYIIGTYNLLFLYQEVLEELGSNGNLNSPNQEVLEEDEPSRLVWKCSCPWINFIPCALRRQRRLCGGPNERGFWCT